MNNKNKKYKTTTLKTLLMLSVVTMMMLIPGGIIPVHAVPGNLLLTINNPTPDNGDSFGFAIASTPDGDLLIGAASDDTNFENSGSAYLYDEMTGNLLLTINNPIPSADELFGRAVAVAPNGNLLIGVMDDNTGATRAGIVHLIDDTGNLLLTINNPTPEYQDRFGITVATTINGNFLFLVPK